MTDCLGRLDSVCVCLLLLAITEKSFHFRLAFSNFFQDTVVFQQLIDCSLDITVYAHQVLIPDTISHRVFLDIISKNVHAALVAGVRTGNEMVVFLTRQVFSLWQQYCQAFCQPTWYCHLIFDQPILSLNGWFL